jgi:8-oxo-dGTP pyrophosphatase MutT (NUDIX family)
MERPIHDPTQRRPHGLTDAWVDGASGRFWGTYGAAGLLLAHPDAGVLLQHRAVWSHHGGTWGVPGGARQQGESAEAAAVREADEEAGVPPELVTVLGESVFDVGYWSYTTVLALATEFFEPVVGDAESIATEWVPFADVDGLPLHPGLRASWPDLRILLAELDPRLS